jgi:MFS family permease
VEDLGPAVTDGQPPAARPRGGVATVVAILFGVQLLMAIVPFGIGALAPSLRDRFDLTRGEVGLAATAIFTSVALLSMPMGRFTDRVGVWRALLVASAVVGTATAAIGLAGTFSALLVLLVVVGIGYAAVNPATNKGVIIAVPRGRRGRAMGVKQTGVTAGGIVAALVLPGAIERAGWEPTLVVAGVAMVLLGWAGALAYRQRAEGLTGRAVTGSGVEPLLPDGPPVPAARLLGLGCIIGVLIGGQHAVGTHLSLFLEDSRGLQAATAASALAILHTSATAARIGWGYVSDRLAGGAWQTVAVIGAASVAALVLLAGFGASLPAPLLVVLIVLLGASTQAGNAVYQQALSEEEEARPGRASGIGMTTGFVGAIVAPPLFGAVADASGSYTLPFLLTAGAVAVASVLALQHLPLRQPSASVESAA